MPGKKKKFNARFPPSRIKKIMQSNEDVGKVAAAVPVIISRALELFVDNLLKKANDVATERRAKTLTPSHLKLCIHSDARLDFLKELVTNVADLQGDLDIDQGGTSMTQASSTLQKESASPFFPSVGSAAKRPEPEDGCQKQTAFPSTNSASSVSVGGERLPHHLSEACGLSSETPSGQNPVASSVPSTSTGRKRGRPRKLGNAGNVTASQRPKKKLLQHSVRNVEDRSHRDQYYKNKANYDSFPSKDDANVLAHAKNVGRVCDEDEELEEDRLPANCDQQSGFRTARFNNDVKHPVERQHSNGSPAADLAEHPRNFTLTVQSDPRESFQLSFAPVHKNGCNTLTSTELPSLATVGNDPVKANDEGITANCEDPQNSGDLVVDEDYDC